jgi:predicted dehydrogenase
MAGVVQAALIGAGGYAKTNVIPYLPLYENVKFVAVCDKDLPAARRAARRIGAATVTDDFQAILARDDIQMVELQTPNYLHAEQAVAAFRAGKHVFSQKPMARTLAEARAMIAAGREAGRLLGVYMDGFDDPFLWDMKAAISAGLIGKVVNFRLRYAHQGGLALGGEAWRRSTDRTGGGCFLLLTVHLTNAVAWLLDTRITRVTGFMKTQMAPMEGDDTTAGAIELASGQIGAAEACYIAAGTPDIPNTVLEIRGTEGALRQQRDDGLLYVYSKNKTFQGQAFTYDKPGKTMKFRRSLKKKDYRPTVHERFATAILGGEPYLCPGEVGMRDLAVALAMAEAARTGCAVDIDEFMKA